MGKLSKKQNTVLNRPWFTVELRKLLKKKNKLYKKYVSNRTPLIYAVYKSARNKYTSSIRSAKKKYFSNAFLKCSNNVKSTWKVVNQLLQKEKVTNDLPSVFQNGDDYLSNPKEIAEHFNNFFVSIGPKLAKLIPDSDGNPLDFIHRTFPVMSSFKPIDGYEVSDIIDQLKPTAAGHDNISAYLVKQVKQSILQPLSHIMPLSLETGVVPDDYLKLVILVVLLIIDPFLFCHVSLKY